MSSRTRTITRDESTLAIECPGSPTPTLSFTNSERAVRIVVPVMSKWSTPYNWHLDPPKCQTLQFMPGGRYDISRSLGLYRSNTVCGRNGSNFQLQPGERNGWSVDCHHSKKEGDPDVEVIIVADLGTENLCRNAVSAQLDKELWPTLQSTPFIIRLVLRLIKLTPLLGIWLWRLVVNWALWVQLLVIFHPHCFYVWCGDIPITWFWDYNPWVDHPPEWAQKAEWRSAELISIWVTRLCWNVGSSMLGMKDSYDEYYRPRHLPGDGGSIETSEKPAGP